MKAVRELLELPEVMLDNDTLGDIDYHESNYSAGQAQAYYDCSKQLQSALEAADIQGLVDRAEQLEASNGLSCPNCDNSGVIPEQDERGEWYPTQCEFCYTVKDSVFNRNKAQEQSDE